MACSIINPALTLVIKHLVIGQLQKSSYTVKQIRKIYGRITGNQLPVHMYLYRFLWEPVKLSHMAGQDRAR